MGLHADHLWLFVEHPAPWTKVTPSATIVSLLGEDRELAGSFGKELFALVPPPRNKHSILTMMG